MQNPVATYRLQFHNDFRFSDLERILSYLKKLGITTLYASPVFEAVPGSTHGYDGVNPQRINPEIGDEKQLRKISHQLKKYGMNWLQDIVPNHMAYHPHNAWLVDVMEKGRNSEYASFFDIDWESPVYDGKLMAPFLGSSLEDAVHNKQLKILTENDKTVLKYFDTAFPLNHASLDFIHRQHSDRNKALHIVNSHPELLLQCIALQYYRLCYWQETDYHINYRRFFTINGLICLNIQDKTAFETCHRYIKQLIEEGIFSGLRIDHIDGLYEPTSYLARLKEFVGDKYVVVEKILHPDETLPEYWDCAGNTGYDFLAIVHNLFTNKKAEKKLTAFYQELSENYRSVSEQTQEKKAYILHHYMRGELENLYRLFLKIKHIDTTKIEEEDLKKALAAFLVACPVYRFYGEELPLCKEEANAVADIFDDIKRKNPRLNAAINIIQKAILANAENASEDDKKNASHFYKRCMQFTGPLAAKGVEDTLMYTYNRFIAHNEVGNSLETFGFSVEEVHLKMIARQKQRHLSMNATSTHDTKRGEDMRARLNVLSDIPGEWIRQVKKWQTLNEGLKEKGAPDAHDEYFIYQTLLGAYPLEPVAETDFGERIMAYSEKALREAKTHSDWTQPNEAYETATKKFVTSVLDKNRPFWKSFETFLEKIIDAGIINALSQLLLKCTCPGIPDIYQGTELWDLNLVDPDNRRAVDYEKRKKILTEPEGKPAKNLLENLWRNRRNGKIKLWLTHRLLEERKNNETVFTRGNYVPLKVAGRYRNHVFAFARRYKNEWFISAVPLHIIQLAALQKKPAENIDWHNTRILLRPEMPHEFQHLFSGENGTAQKVLFIKDIFRKIPLAFIKMKQPETKRGAGILLAISSLPSAFGVGDLGKEAYAFIKFLSRSRQKYWQILPLNPTESGAGHSPYSSCSGMAGNPLLISPEALCDEGLIDAESLKNYFIEAADRADYTRAEHIKQSIFEQAYQRFSSKKFSALQRAFENFCMQEADWLDDMALYKVLKNHYNGKPWYEWEKVFKLRDKKALEDFKRRHTDAVKKIKWLQFIFFRQWKALKEFAHIHHVQMFGDMPFYISYDSADVWAHRELFCLDGEGNRTGIAGVPPDYFSETGQLWGMPTFNWHKLKERNYDWWIRRLQKNLELFDVLRIDHFRAFQDYWQVPAGASTAIHGQWLPGPRTDFFDAVKKQIGKLPFVAEDLGDKMESVYELRDAVGLPGMKVLQFAWGDNMPQSVDIPHNHEINSVVYTGTHDNNTTVGWYEEETNKADHARMHLYLGLNVRQKNIHHILARAAYSSVAQIAILPMQDILGLGAAHRMNTPGKTDGNWLWRLKPNDLNEKIEKMLRGWVEIYGR